MCQQVFFYFDLMDTFSENNRLTVTTNGWIPQKTLLNDEINYSDIRLHLYWVCMALAYMSLIAAVTGTLNLEINKR